MCEKKKDTHVAEAINSFLEPGTGIVYSSFVVLLYIFAFIRI